MVGDMVLGWETQLGMIRGVREGGCLRLDRDKEVGMNTGLTTMIPPGV